LIVLGQSRVSVASDKRNVDHRSCGFGKLDFDAMSRRRA
jgi:hypothetical protein